MTSRHLPDSWEAAHDRPVRKMHLQQRNVANRAVLPALPLRIDEYTFKMESSYGGSWTIAFFLVAIGAALVAFTTLTGDTFEIAKILALIFGVLALVALLAANRARHGERNERTP